jgi:hypothetical protein
LDGTIHPDDQPVFRGEPALRAAFNLQFPPPAFVGDVDAAPVVILMSSGGYKPGITEAEFPDAKASDDYRRYLQGELLSMPETMSDYYRRGPLGRWLEDGKAALVNAVAYRTPSLSSVPNARRLVGLLPSVTLHRAWVKEDLLPSAQRGERFVLVHRNGFWGLPQIWDSSSVAFSTNPISPYPAEANLTKVREWLAAKFG